jgi:PAS domain-containing protein
MQHTHEQLEVESGFQRVLGSGALTRRPDLRTRLMFWLVLPSLILLPVIAVWLHQLRGVLEMSDRIVLHDVKVSTAAQVLARDILMARSEIKSFLLDGDIAHFETSRRIAANLPGLVDELGGLLGEEHADVRHLASMAREYGARTDSLLSMAVRLRAQDLVGTRDFRRVDQITADALEISDRVETRAATDLEGSRKRIASFAVRARRDVMTVLILTVIVEALIVVLLPRLLMRPLKQLIRVLRLAEQGRLDVRSDLSGDEVGQLGQAVNHVLDAFQDNDALKSSKIVELANRFRIVAEAAACGVLVLDPDLKPLYANAWLCRRAGCNEPDFTTLSLESLFDPADAAHQLTTLLLRPEGDFVESGLRTPAGLVPVRLTCRAALDREGDLANLVVFVQEAAVSEGSGSSPGVSRDAAEGAPPS